MIQKLSGWDTVQAFDGSVETIPAGGHVCKIMRVRMEKSRSNQDMMALALEINEGTQLDGVAGRMFESRKSSAQNPLDAKWPVVYRQLLVDREGKCNSYFKGMIKSIEDSNTGYKWNWDENSLQGKSIGVIFREEEFEANDGTVKTTTRPAFIRSAAAIRNGVNVPEVKRLPNSGTTYSAPPAWSSAAYANPADDYGTPPPPSMQQMGFIGVDDDELPF